MRNPLPDMAFAIACRAVRAAFTWRRFTACYLHYAPRGTVYAACTCCRWTCRDIACLRHASPCACWFALDLQFRAHTWAGRLWAPHCLQLRGLACGALSRDGTGTATTPPYTHVCAASTPPTFYRFTFPAVLPWVLTAAAPIAFYLVPHAFVTRAFHRCNLSSCVRATAVPACLYLYPCVTLRIRHTRFTHYPTALRITPRSHTLRCYAAHVPVALGSPLDPNSAGRARVVAAPYNLHKFCCHGATGCDTALPHGFGLTRLLRTRICLTRRTATTYAGCGCAFKGVLPGVTRTPRRHLLILAATEHLVAAHCPGTFHSVPHDERV